MNSKKLAMGKMSQNQIDSNSGTFWEHVDAFRQALLKSFFSILCATLLSLFFYQEIFTFLKAPLEEQPCFHHETINRERVVNHTQTTQLFTLPIKGDVVSASQSVMQRDSLTYLIPPNAFLSFEYTEPKTQLAIFGPLEGMLMTFKLSFWVGLTASSPFWLYFIFSFIAPALTKRSNRLIIPFICSSLVFMFFGFLFAYTLTIPIANEYLTLFNQDIGQNIWSLSNYMDYTITLLLGNGIAFEGLVIGLFLVHYKKLTAEQLIAFRRYFIVFAFIIGAILTPPDILTQLMLAVPLIAFYEIIIVYARVRGKERVLLHTHVN